MWGDRLEQLEVPCIGLPRDSAGESSKKIDEIRVAYDKTFPDWLSRAEPAVADSIRLGSLVA